MKEEIDFTKVPYQYAMCLNRKCSKANTCLRQLTEQSVPEKIEYWDILSPKHLAALQGDCPYYRSNTKVRYAKGFIKILEALPYKQMQAVISHLMSFFWPENLLPGPQRRTSPYPLRTTKNIDHSQELRSYSSTGL